MQVTWDSPHQSLLDTVKLLLKPEGEWIHPRTHRCHFKGRSFNGREGGFLGRTWLAPQEFRLALLHKLREGQHGVVWAGWGHMRELQPWDMECVTSVTSHYAHIPLQILVLLSGSCQRILLLQQKRGGPWRWSNIA